ncbi:small cardioactive peptides-like isoform X4 [Magallana gigas]|uniref:small cardioactive peptides-like isoform X4 n=1 Tax=Magallana gigas TaxID=29159 RepID=UPI00148A8B76|nr:small cardioactive peptides-like isoform X2 [Crassostrea gigas]
MIVSGITSFMLLFVLLLQTDAKPTSALRQKRAPGFQFPRLGRLQEYESEVNKRGIQFPRLGRKRSSLADMHTYREYAEKMLNSADDDFPHDIREKLLSMLHSDDEGPTNRIIII